MKTLCEVPVHQSLGAYARTTVPEACLLALAHPSPMVNTEAPESLQICPQNNREIFDVGAAQALCAHYPDIAFRLHANVRVLTEKFFWDLSKFDASHVYWQTLSSVSQALSANGYTAHAGFRREASLQAVFDATKEATQLFGCPVGVEGMYPAKGNPYLLDSWEEYAQLLDANVYFALDLSHLNIVRAISKRYERQLVRALLSSEHCIEVHLSGNGGKADQHHAVTDHRTPIWFDDLPWINRTAMVYTEETVSFNANKSMALI